MLGLRADAPNGRLSLNPTLPTWLSSLELSGLQVGPACLDLRFWREGTATRFAVKSREGGELDVRWQEGADRDGPPSGSGEEHSVRDADPFEPSPPG